MVVALCSVPSTSVYALLVYVDIQKLLHDAITYTVGVVRLFSTSDLGHPRFPVRGFLQCCRPGPVSQEGDTSGLCHPLQPSRLTAGLWHTAW